MKKLKEKILFLGLSPKKEFKSFIILNFVLLFCCAAIYLLTKNLSYTLFGICAFPVAWVLFITKYSSKIDQLNAINLEEFTNLFSYFKIYLHNGYSVYSSLKEIQAFSNDSLNKMIGKLIEEIDIDKSVQPFINFAKNFNEIIIEEMMISIYQMIDDGENSEYLIQFELIFDKFSDLMYQKNLKKKDSKLGTLSSAPLIGSCYLMVVLTIGIVSVIGVMINGL